MTDHNPTHTHYNDNADESSSLFLTVADASPSFSFDQKKTNGSMRLMIATTCFFLGTIAVIYGGRGSNSSSYTSAGGISADLLRGYDPSSDFCFKDNENADKYCWYPKDDFPVGNWQGVTCAGGHGCAQCGSRCTEVYMYDPNQDYCFKDKANEGKYCWYTSNNYPYPTYQWEAISFAEYDNCGPECTDVVVNNDE